MGKKNNILQHAQQVKLIQNLEYENHKNKNRGWNWKTDVSLGVIYQHVGCFLPVETPKKLRKHLESLIVSSDPKHELYREKVLSKSAINLILEHLGGADGLLIV